MVEQFLKGEYKNYLKPKNNKFKLLLCLQPSRFARKRKREEENNNLYIDKKNINTTTLKSNIAVML